MRSRVRRLVRRSELHDLRQQLDDVYAKRAAPLPTPPLPAGAADMLRPDNPTLHDLARRYEDHPAADPSQWSAEYIGNTIDMRVFRANNSYVWQQWDTADPFRYGLTTYYARLHDKFCLFDRLYEDAAFGAESYDVDGTIVSRDLLDSINELTFLEDELAVSRGLTILDIGAGYGRLAHRATSAFEQVRYLCTDAVPLSTFLSSYYLEFRGVDDRATVVPLDRIEETVVGTDIDLAINIHSFAEAPADAIAWWLDLLARSSVRHLLIVPNTEDRLLSKERNAPRIDFTPLVDRAGFELMQVRPKYAGSEFMQRHGLHGSFPMYYFLFARR